MFTVVPVIQKPFQKHNWPCLLNWAQCDGPDSDQLRTQTKQEKLIVQAYTVKSTHLSSC